MKKILSVIIGILCLSTFSMFANQIGALPPEPPVLEWQRAYGGTNDDMAHSAIQTSDGGYAIVGYTTSFGAGGMDVWLIKTDVSGNMQWNKTYGGTNDEAGYSLVETSDGGYTVAGWTDSFGAGDWDFWLVKADACGNMQWSKTYGGASHDQANSVIQTGDGGYILAGYTSSFGAGYYDAWLVKTDWNGDMQWSQTYGGVGQDVAYSVVQTSDGGYALAGDTINFGAGYYDAWLVKTDADGNMQWSTTYGGTNHDDAYSMAQTGDGGYLLAGYTNSFGVGEFDFWLVKTDESGNMQWSKTYGGTSIDHAFFGIQTSDGGYAIIGETTSFGAGYLDIWLVKTDANGNMQWNQTYGGTDRDTAFSVVQTSDGGYAVAGATRSFGAGNFDSWLIKLMPPMIIANIDIDPCTLNLESRGEWITAYIELPESYNVADINVSSILLNKTIPVCPCAPTAIGDYDSDGIPDLMIKFSRAEVMSFILANVNITELLEEGFMTVTLTITGELTDGTPFQGSDTIKIMLPTHGKRGIFPH